MRISLLITLTAFTFSVIILSGCSANCNKASETGKSFLKNLYTCNFMVCDALCTENGKGEVRWFASNLTEDDLAIISQNVEIEAQEDEISETSASILYMAKNVIICDSMETKSYLGERTIKVILKKDNGSWKVDKLEW